MVLLYGRFGAENHLTWRFGPGIQSLNIYKWLALGVLAQMQEQFWMHEIKGLNLSAKAYIHTVFGAFLVGAKLKKWEHYYYYYLEFFMLRYVYL